MPDALKIIKKYNRAIKLVKLKKHNENCVFPKMSLGYYDSLLKKIAEQCSINRLSSHMARHTFATQMLDKGVAIDAISKMLGHSRISTTEIYAKTTINKISNELDKVVFA